MVGGLQVWALLVLALLPGLASYFFQPKRLSVEQHNRAIALSYYAWAPWACAPLALPAFIGTLARWPPRFTQTFVSASFLCLIGVVLVVFFLVLLCERRIVQFAMRLLHRRLLAALGTIAIFHFLAIALGLLAGLVPLSIFYIVVVVSSLL